MSNNSKQTGVALITSHEHTINKLATKIYFSLSYGPFNKAHMTSTHVTTLGTILYHFGVLVSEFLYCQLFPLLEIEVFQYLHLMLLLCTRFPQDSYLMLLLLRIGFGSVFSPFVLCAFNHHFLTELLDYNFENIASFATIRYMF